MREAIGGSWLFGLVITFIVFFASFLAVSVNYSKAFNVKNNVVDMLSKYEGNNACAREAIGNYLKSTGYLVDGYCPEGYDGYLQNGTKVTSGKSLYCIKTNTVSSSHTLNKKYYGVVVFFRIDLPAFGNLTTFRVTGESESIYYAVDDTLTTCTP